MIHKLKDMLLAARKSDNKVAKSVLPILISDIERKKSDPVAEIKKYLANAQECFALSSDNKYAEEIELLISLLPKQLTEDDLHSILMRKGFKDMKTAMSFLKLNYSGQYDGKLASKILKELLP